MSNDNVIQAWSDIDPSLQAGLKCDIEIVNELGTSKEIDKSTAWALRQVASQLEAGALETGFHPVTGPDGAKIGEVYLDFYETGPR